MGRFAPLLHAACVLVLLWACAGILPTAVARDAEPADARAEEGSALDALTPAELDFLKKKFPEWDQVDARRKEHIARNIIRLREMSPAEREKLKARVERLHGRRSEGGQGQRWKGARMFRMADEVGGRLLVRLPEPVREALGGLDVRPSMVKMTLFRMLKAKAAAAESADVSDEELSAWPDSMRARYLRMREGAAGNPKQAAALRGLIQRLRLGKQMEKLQAELGSEGPSPEGPTARYAEALLQAWAEPAQSLLEELAADPRRLLSSVERAERDHMTPGDYEKSIRALERLAETKWSRDAEALAAADLVVRRLLIDRLGADRAVVDALPGYAAGDERRKALAKLLPSETPPSEARSRPGGKGRGGRPGRGGKRRGSDGGDGGGR